MRSSLVRSVKVWLALRKVDSKLLAAVETTIARSTQLSLAEAAIAKLKAAQDELRAEVILLRSSASARNRTIRELQDKSEVLEAEAREADATLATMTGELELLRGIVDNESPGLSERVRQASAALAEIHSTAPHDHEAQ